MAALIQRMRFLADHRWSPRRMSEYLDGELSAEGRVRIERHLHDCPKCREILRSLRATVGGLARIRRGRPGPPGSTVAPAVLDRVREELEEEGEDGRDV